ncbi:MAG: hypothetical protein WCX31_18305 [Salinivirgaceae bacterium]
MYKGLVFIIIVIGLLPATFCQEKFTIDGYISQMGSSVFVGDSSNATWDYILHNRINTAYYFSNNVTAKLQFRNQFLWGETVELTPNYAEKFAQDNGFFDLNWNWYSGSKTLLNTQIDRAFVEYTSGKFELSIGRQRINWGRTLVWNPNDIFNAYSYYEFDYPEKPGSDAVRAVYYSGSAASYELVAKIDSANNLTIAGLKKINKRGYDFQFLGGFANGEDFVLGTGWEGSIKQFAFRGEMTYYHPQKNWSDTTGVFLASIGTDISFSNSLMIQAEFLYNDTKTLTQLNQIYAAPANSKSLSISEYNFFANITYPMTPILSAYMAGMYYTDQNGFFLMPGFDVSVTNNLNFSLIYQYFNMKITTNQRIRMNMAFGRLKWNF